MFSLTVFPFRGNQVNYYLLNGKCENNQVQREKVHFQGGVMADSLDFAYPKDFIQDCSNYRVGNIFLVFFFPVSFGSSLFFVY